MPSYIVKCAPDVDLYMVWSTIVEAPTAVGNRAAFERTHDVERIDRADRTGTSALWPSEADPYLGWADTDGPIYEQRGYLPRSRFVDFANRYAAGVDILDLIEPFEDDEEEEPS